MTNIIKTLLFYLTGKPSYNSKTEHETTETKKCMNCLQRIEYKYLRCPKCGSSNFHLNDK